MVGHAQPSPGRRVGQRLSPTQGNGSAEPWQVSGYRRWTAQPVPGRCAASPDHPTGAATWAAIILTAMSLGTVGIRPRRTPIPGPSGRRVGRRLSPTTWAGRPPVANGCPTGDAPPTPVGARRCRARPRHRRGKHGGTQPWALTIPVRRSPPRPPWIPGSPGPAGQAAPDPEVMGYRVLDDRCGVGAQRRGTSSGRGVRYGVSPVGARRGAPCGAVDPRGMHLTGRERRTGAVLVGHLAGLLGAPAASSARAPAWGCCARSTGWQTAIVAQC